MLQSYSGINEYFQDIPGLSVVQSYSDGADIEAVYDDEKGPMCPYDERIGVPNGYNARSAPIYDRIEEQIIRVKFKQRRYICPLCNREIPYDNPYIRNGRKTTERMNAWIGLESLYHSYDDVSQMTGGAVSKAGVGRIAESWVKEGIQEYYLNLEAPENLGIHIVGQDNHPYILLTDLSSDRMVDFVPAIDFFQRSEDNTLLFTTLIRLDAQKTIKHVCTAIDPDCLSPAKNVFASLGIDTFVARSSIYKLFTDAVHEALVQKNEESKGQMLLDMVATPLAQSLTPDEQEKMVHLAARFNNDASTWVSSLLELRKIILDKKWTAKNYLTWKTNISRAEQFEKQIKYLNCTHAEIRSGFGKDYLHLNYEENSKIANHIIAANRRCSFDSLRARMLLTVEPETYRPKGSNRDKITGISMSKLQSSMDQRLHLKDESGTWVYMTPNG